MAYKRISPQPVVEGGTGASSLTAHGVLIGEGTSAITPTAVGTTGQVLTGVTGADPVWASPASSSISITGNTGGALTGNAFTFTGGTTGITFNGAGSTETLGGTLVVSNGGSGAGTFTAHGVLLGEGTSAFGVTAVGTTGQVLTGVTGADPVWAAPAASSISITGNSGGALTGNAFTFTGGTTGLTFAGAGSTETLGGTLAISNGGTNATSMTTTDGVIYYDGTRLVTTTAGTSGQVLTSNGAGVAPTYQAAASSTFPWTLTTVDATLVVNNGYIANKAGLLTMTLPASATVGQVIAITNINTAVGWRIAQNASQQIFMGNQSTTAGVTGYLEATALGDTVNIICTTAGSSTVWQAVYLIGNITVN